MRLNPLGFRAASNYRSRKYNSKYILTISSVVYSHVSLVLFLLYEFVTLLISIGKLKPTIGMITYRNTCALDSKGKIAYKLILKLLPVIFLGKCSSNSNYFGL